ncbi:AAA family ATPase [Hansschlegelia plantiphila]|uniref:AAA+ ATPase domain-containing protein n=1 Tax=Hansschlegelia plantiphila TaxID=374655 RepID=A0A9W6MWK7_9HYPH|nr:AAA family ATPase [Hansschlegelia plantiphila]GLK68965.1 hypothetical protein GCM10008179_26030 [Hansschlegelia plantiphila]
MIASRFLFHRLDRLPEPPIRREIVKGLVAEGEIVALVGSPGGGKSALAVLLSTCFARGDDFLGRKVEQGGVVYIAAERVKETQRRLLASAGPEGRIFVTGGRPLLAEAKDIAEIADGVRMIAAMASPLRLVVIDTAAKCMRGLDENSARDVGLAVEGLTVIAEAAPTAMVLVLHHLAKGGSSMRGSSALLGAVDLEMTVRAGGGRRLIEVTKANAVAEGQTFPFRLEPIETGAELVIAARPCEAPASCPVSAKEPITLSRDARTALRCLHGLGGAADVEAWRTATYAAFGDRKPSAKRVAFNSARKRLGETGVIAASGNSVSVSEA